MTRKSRAWTETCFHTLASEMALCLRVIKIKMFFFFPLSPQQYFFSAEDVKNRIYPSLDAIFFSPSVSSQLHGLQPTQTVPSHFTA